MNSVRGSLRIQILTVAHMFIFMLLMIFGLLLRGVIGHGPTPPPEIRTQCFKVQGLRAEATDSGFCRGFYRGL